MIVGDKIDLHGFGKEELHNTLKWKNDPEVKPFIGTLYPISMEEHKRWFDRICSDKNTRFFAIKDKKGKHVGNINLRIDWKNRNAEFGMVISKKEQGKGYGTDALKTLTKFAFDELNLHRIGCRIFEFNESAIKVYKKLGFGMEGCMKDAIFTNGKYNDVLLVGRLNK